MLLFATLFSHQEASSCVSPASCLTREISRGFFWDGISLEQNTLCVCAWRFRLAAQWRRGGCVFVFFSGCWFYLPTYQFRGRNTFSWEMTNSKQTKKCCTFDNEDADVAFDDYKRRYNRNTVLSRRFFLFSTRWIKNQVGHFWIQYNYLVLRKRSLVPINIFWQFFLNLNIDIRIE